MKNKIRASDKNGNKPPSSQPQKPSIRGQESSELGHIGKLLGFTDQQVQAYAQVAAWHGQSLKSYLRVGALGILQSSVDELQDASGANFTPRERTAKALFCTIESLFRDIRDDDLTVGGRPLDDGESVHVTQSETDGKTASVFPLSESDWRRCFACCRGKN
jgi:hypothetical protein